MNQYFDFNRWWLLVRLHWAENQRRYLLTLLAAGGLMVGWFSFILTMDRDYPMNMGYQFGTYYVGLFFTGCLYGSLLFSELGRKREAIQYLSVPASQWEKLLCGLFFGVVLFFLAYTIVFYLVDIPMVGLASRMAKQRPPEQLSAGRLPEVFNVFSNKGGPVPDEFLTLPLMAFFAIQAAFILGSVYFTRYTFVKTTIALLLLSLLGSLFITKGVEANLPHGWHMYGLFQWSSYDEKNEQWVLLAPGTEKFLRLLIEYSLPFIFWVITYFRLKEKEV